MVTDDNGDCGVEVEAPRDARDDSALRAIAEALAQGRPIIADTISSLLMMVLISIAAGEQAARSVSYALPDDSDEQARMRALADQLERSQVEFLALMQTLSERLELGAKEKVDASR